MAHYCPTGNLIVIRRCRLTHHAQVATGLDWSGVAKYDCWDEMKSVGGNVWAEEEMKSRACCLLPPGSGENKKSVKRGNIMLGKSLAVFLRMRRGST